MRLILDDCGGTMLVTKISHATLIVEAGGVRCLMDPVLLEPFECATNRFEPPIEIDPRGVAGAYDAIVLSHEHGDHFCIRTLELLDRRCPVLFPAACGLIWRALTAMGFRDLRPLDPGQTVALGPLALTATPSEVVFPEMGVLFSHGGTHFWNCVDSDAGAPAFSIVRQRAPRLDLMFAKYQPLIEDELGRDALGWGFPFRRHARNVEVVLRADPRCVVPASCGYRYAAQPWQNQRGFPVTEREFLDDVRALRPGIAGVSLPQAASIDARDFTVRTNALPWVRTSGVTSTGALDWRPDRGVPPLEDEDPYGHGAAALRNDIEAYLRREFFDDFENPGLGEWRERLGAAGVVWQLEVVYPGGATDIRWLDFAGPRTWLSAPPRPAKMITSICASTLAGLRSGEVVPYRTLFTRRVVLKLYAVTRGGIEQIGDMADEPIARLLHPTANRRNVDFELRRLGYRVPDAEPEVEEARGLRAIRSLPRRLT